MCAFVGNKCNLAHQSCLCGQGHKRSNAAANAVCMCIFKERGKPAPATASEPPFPHKSAAHHSSVCSCTAYVSASTVSSSSTSSAGPLWSSIRVFSERAIALLRWRYMSSAYSMSPSDKGASVRPATCGRGSNGGQAEALQQQCKNVPGLQPAVGAAACGQSEVLQRQGKNALGLPSEAAFCHITMWGTTALEEARDSQACYMKLRQAGRKTTNGQAPVSR